MPLKYESGSTPAAAALDALIRGPVTGEYLPVLSPNTHVNTIYIKDGLCQVDFNRGFLEKVADHHFSLNVYSVVNTLADLDEINQVSITIDGATVDEAPDDMSLKDPFWPSDTYVLEPGEEMETLESEQTETIMERSAPETKAQGTGTSETKAKETAAPETKANETAAPETKVNEEKH